MAIIAMYILECSNGLYYVGSTKDLHQRLNQHSIGNGANFTAKHLPIKRIFYEEFTSILFAFQREQQIKKWSAKKKKALMDGEIKLLIEFSKSKKDSGNCK